MILRHKYSAFTLFFLGTLLLSIGSCKKGYEARFGPFYILDDTTVVVNGDMGSRVDNQLERLLNKYPGISYAIMEKCPGSRDDEELFKAARMLYNQDVHIHLPPNAKIESGAVDLFLAGTTRTMDEGAKIGVHAWSDGNTSATAYPVGHEEHEIYIDYYASIGYSQQEAENLYYFIINAAGPNNIHYMTAEEILAFGILNP